MTIKSGDSRSLFRYPRRLPRLYSAGETLAKWKGRKLRYEVLNREIFPRFKDLEKRLREAIDSYNNLRPHSALGNIAPSTFAARYRDVDRTSSSQHTYNQKNATIKEVTN